MFPSMCIRIKWVRSKVRLSGNARIASVHGPPYLLQRLVWPITVWVFLVSACMPPPWQRSFILFFSIKYSRSAGCCTVCDVRCVYMCCNKSRLIWNVYKIRLLINIIVETSASPLFTTERIQPEFSSFSIILDDIKLKRTVHTMPEVPPHKYRT